MPYAELKKIVENYKNFLETEGIIAPSTKDFAIQLLDGFVAFYKVYATFHKLG